MTQEIPAVPVPGIPMDNADQDPATQPFILDRCTLPQRFAEDLLHQATHNTNFRVRMTAVTVTPTTRAVPAPTHATPTPHHEGRDTSEGQEDALPNGTYVIFALREQPVTGHWYKCLDRRDEGTYYACLHNRGRGGHHWGVEHVGGDEYFIFTNAGRGVKYMRLAAVGAPGDVLTDALVRVCVQPPGRGNDRWRIRGDGAKFQITVAGGRLRGWTLCPGYHGDCRNRQSRYLAVRQVAPGEAVPDWFVEAN